MVFSTIVAVCNLSRRVGTCGKQRPGQSLWLVDRDPARLLRASTPYEPQNNPWRRNWCVDLWSTWGISNRYSALRNQALARNNCFGCIWVCMRRRGACDSFEEVRCWYHHLFRFCDDLDLQYNLPRECWITNG